MAITRFMRAPFRRQPPQTDQAFGQWLNSPLGQSVLDTQKHVLEDVLARLVGYRALQCSVGEPVNLLDTSRFRNHYLMSRQAEGAGHIRGRADSLPFAKQSLDLVLLHHSLDFDDNPHQILREATRALVPGGALVVVGFNPVSLAGIHRLLMLASRKIPWVARFLSPGRVSDWLNLLACEPENYESGFYLPLAGERVRKSSGWLDRLGSRFWSQRGAFYVLVARKRAVMMRPNRSRFSLPEAAGVIPISMARVQREQKPENPSK